MKMKTGKKSIALSFLVLASLLGTGGMAEAEAADPYSLDEVVVTADKNRDREVYDDEVSPEEAATWMPGGYQRESSNLGLLGNQDVMKQPFVTQSFSQKTLSQTVSPSGNMSQVLDNSPAVRTGTSPIKTDFSIRGMLANGSAMYMNNIPGFYIMASGPMVNSIGRADVAVGPMASLTGTVQSYNGPDAGQPGSIFLYSKRPDINRNEYTQTYGGYGHWGELFDVSRAGMGKNGTWGLRVYGMHDRGGLPISGSRQKRSDIFIDLEHKDRKSDTNIFAGYFDDRLWGGERRFTIDRNASHVPHAPDAKKSYDDPHYMHQFDYGYLFTLNHEQKINDHFAWFLNAGMNETTIRRFIFWSQISLDGNGNLINNRLWSQHFLLRNRYVQGGLQTSFNTGAVKHQAVISVDRSWRKLYNKRRRDRNGEHVWGNIYSGIHFAPSMYSYDISDRLGNSFQLQEMDTGLNLADQMTYKKWTLDAAVNRRHGNYRGAGEGNQIKDDNWSPTVGLTYSPNDNLSFYAAYAKATTRGQLVGQGYDNEGTILDPVKVSQREAGVKYKWDNFFASLSYFDMKQPNYIDVPSSGPNGVSYELDGRNRYKGVDFNITGKISSRWNIFGGFEYLHARQEKTQGGLKDGMPTDGSAKWSALLGLEYHINDRFSLMGRMNYVGHGVITGNNRRELRVPSYTNFDFFATYKTNWKVPVTWKFSVYNAFNKNHWIHQPGQGNKLMLNMPRTYMLTAQIAF